MAGQDLARLAQHAADETWLPAYDAFAARLEDAANPTVFLSAVHPDVGVREAAEACEQRWNSFFSALSQNPALYRAASVAPARDDIDRELLERIQDEARDAGVALPPAQRLRAKALSDEVAQLGQQFERNVREAKVELALDEAELEGVPASVWQSAPRNAAGQRLLGLAYPIYMPVMQTALRTSTRENFWRAKQNEGGQANLELLSRITRLRHEWATLMQHPSYAHARLHRRMARQPQTAQAFLDDVQQAVAQREQRELQELREAKAAHLGQPVDQTRLNRWDVAFYQERVRQARYQVDQEALRVHFPPQESLAFALRLIERLMDVRYERVHNMPTWHPEVQTYAVRDARSAQHLGLLHVDLYPREGKYGHAAVWPLRHSSTHSGRPSEAALVVNFDRHGLTLDELETLLHELGHAVHGNLSRTRWSQQAGTSVLQDFVEAPSQMLEDWVYDPQALALFAEVCPACRPMPRALIEKARRARHFGVGIEHARQRLYAAYDLQLHGTAVQDPLALWAAMEAATPLGHVQGTLFPAGFGHTATHYGAGYYGYLWSLVVAADLRTAFGGQRLDANVGRRYRDTVLAKGSQKPPQELVRAFLGREFNARAFDQELRRED
jgi:thimet oligopeptidase